MRRRRAAEILHLEPELRQRGRVRHQRLMLAGTDLEHDRAQQPLRFERPADQPLGDLLEQDALVRHVLVDDRHALVVHRDDERVAELAERRHRPDERRDRPPGRPASPSRASGHGHGRWPRPPLPRPRVARPASQASWRHQRGALRTIRAARRRGARPEAQRQRTRLRRARRERRARRQHQLRAPCRAQRIDNRAAQDFMHQPLIEEPHFGLGRMHVHVHAIRPELDEQMDFRAALLDRRDAVGR